MASRRRKVDDEAIAAEEDDDSLLVAEAGGIVTEVGSPLRPTDVDEFVRLQDASERLTHLRTFIRAWSQQQKEERALRKTYATALIAILASELALTFLAFYLLAFKVGTSGGTPLAAFLVTALVQSAALVMVVVRYLFPDRTADVLRLIESSLPQDSVAKPRRR